jgi:aminoglycoside phosphotransferase family enzyme
VSDACGSLVSPEAGVEDSSNGAPADGAAADGAATAAGPPGEPYAAVLESHLSVVLLIGALALKFKKPARLPFVDLSTQAARRDVCLAELDLNRRLTPDVYLGVAELTAPLVPEVAGEPVLVMRRLPDACRLTRLLAGGTDLRPALTDIARQLVGLHTAQRPELRSELLANTRRLWAQGREQLRRFEPEVLAGPDVDEVAALAAEYLAGRAELLNDRERRGLVRDGHGDLLADDLFCLPDGVRVLDCLEFDRALRVNDVLADVAFLAMDLRLRGAPELARFFVDRYREHSAESHPVSLEQHYVAYRAFVRAKVECLRHEQGDPEAADRARRLLALALDRLRAARVRLVLVGGLPGSGKSTLATALADSSPAAAVPEPGVHEPAVPEPADGVLLSSDAVRRDLCRGTASAGSAAYRRR